MGGKLIGLEYKLKSESSLFRKIMSDLDEERKAESGLTVVDVAAKCAHTFRPPEPCQPFSVWLPVPSEFPVPSDPWWSDPRAVLRKGATTCSGTPASSRRAPTWLARRRS